MVYSKCSCGQRLRNDFIRFQHRQQGHNPVFNRVGNLKPLQNQNNSPDRFHRTRFKKKTEENHAKHKVKCRSCRLCCGIVYL